MAVSNEEVQQWLSQNPNATPQDIQSAMNQYGVSATQLSQATGWSPEQINASATKAGISNYDVRNAGSAAVRPLVPGKLTNEQINYQYLNNAQRATGDDITKFAQKYGVSLPQINQATGVGSGVMHKLYTGGNISLDDYINFKNQYVGQNVSRGTGGWGNYSPSQYQMNTGGMFDGNQRQTPNMGTGYTNPSQTGGSNGRVYAGGNPNFDMRGGQQYQNYGKQGMFGGTATSRQPYTGYQAYQPYGGNARNGMFGAPTMNYNMRNKPMQNYSQSWSQNNPYSYGGGMNQGGGGYYDAGLNSPANPYSLTGGGKVTGYNADGTPISNTGVTNPWSPANPPPTMGIM